ncbi:MAG: nucleotidyltransferase family protein [Planctomycetes bacterium]|nr:nucleotidyltransferase family protein [Planctomycetota bacterium]
MSVTKSQNEILKMIAEHRDEINRFGVRRLGLFGSAVRGEATQESDLDFLVEFEIKSFDAYMDLKFFLEDLFRCQVDLVIADAIKPRLRESILKEAVHAPGF